MTVRKHNDAKGYARGTGAYSDANIKLAKPQSMPPIFTIADTDGDMGAGALPRGGPPRYKPKSAGFDPKFNGAWKVKG